MMKTNILSELVIYSNEVDYLIEEIKEQFNKRYKNLILSVTRHEENDLLQGLNFNIISTKLEIHYSVYVPISGIFTYNDYIDYCRIKIDDLFKRVIKEYFYV